MPKNKKREALSVSRLITEVLVNQLSIPFKQIVNDTSFTKYTGIDRPDILISEFIFDGSNEDQFIQNLVAYAEAKDNCSVGDKDWNDAKKQGVKKSKLLNLPYFIVTNCHTTIFYNTLNSEEIKINGNPIREFQTIDILRLIKNKLSKEPRLTDILTNVDSLSAISEAIFNKKLWEIEDIYRDVSFNNNIQKIDFTIGFVALEFYYEKSKIEGKYDESKVNWDDAEGQKPEILVGTLSKYIDRLMTESDGFNEFNAILTTVKTLINKQGDNTTLVSPENVQKIYDIVNRMRPLHGTGFDLFGAVYEAFANAKEKKDFGEYFTRRHYTHVFSKLLFRNENYFNEERIFSVLDPACGTGGFLTESFKVLQNNFIKSGTLSKKAVHFLSQDCFYGTDIRGENISRTKLNMFLVGDGHTHIRKTNDSLKDDFQGKQYDYIITNPPYGNGTVKAESKKVSTTRKELAFLYKIIKLLKVGGRACVVIPDGVLENPSYTEIRKEFLEVCTIESIISLPKFAFAPYTKEKTYAVFFEKRSNIITKIQSKNIWMYIIDNDGFANSDKRFRTKLRNNRNGWKHDEISGWVNTDGEEKPGILETRYMIFDDLLSGGTEWVDEKGIQNKMNKGGFINIQNIVEDKYLTLLPEYYMRPYEPNFVTLDELNKEITSIINLF